MTVLIYTKLKNVALYLYQYELFTLTLLYAIHKFTYKDLHEIERNLCHTSKKLSSIRDRCRPFRAVLFKGRYLLKEYGPKLKVGCYPCIPFFYAIRFKAQVDDTESRQCGVTSGDLIGLSHHGDARDFSRSWRELGAGTLHIRYWRHGLFAGSSNSLACAGTF